MMNGRLTILSAVSASFLCLTTISCRSHKRAEADNDARARSQKGATPAETRSPGRGGTHEELRFEKASAGTPDSGPEAVHALNPFVSILHPTVDGIVENPVTFRFQGGGGIITVGLFVDGLPLQSSPIGIAKGSHIHDLAGVNMVRHLVMEGYGDKGTLLAVDELDFVPSEGFIPPPPGFNTFIIRTINDLTMFPRNGDFPYCWRECPGSMGMVRDTLYQGELMWEGEDSCFCSGHTLEVLLSAVRRWAAHHGLDDDEQFGDLTYRSLRGGDFYQHWQGYGVAEDASSAAALESAGVGYTVTEDMWDTALPGDFVNLTRTNGTGHAVIFIAWVKQDGAIAGIRYYGCSRKGDSCPDPEDVHNVAEVSGPSFKTEMFFGSGGQVLPEYLHIGHPVDPLIGY